MCVQHPIKSFEHKTQMQKVYSYVLHYTAWKAKPVKLWLSVSYKESGERGSFTKAEEKRKQNRIKFLFDPGQKWGFQTSASIIFFVLWLEIRQTGTLVRVAFVNWFKQMFGLYV